MEDDSLDPGSALHISDVIDVIQMDAERTGNTVGNTMSETGDRRHLSAETARIVIVEQPASKALRFRYECEGRSAGSIPGVHSTPENKTFPTIKVEGYQGKAAVIVSCVTKDPPYRPHPHNLVGKEGCNKGVFSQQVFSNNMVISFSNLGIQCVKKKDIEEALRVREEIRVDPFRTGFAHRSHPTGIDLNAVRLCFQVFLEGPKRDTYTRALTPVVSEPIYDKKAMSDLVICNLSDASASVGGGKEMILLCEKVAKEDIQIRFYEEKDHQVKWEAYADFQPSQVHKQVAISFRTPRYERLEVDGPVSVFIQLKRPSDNAVSEPRPFQLLPLDSDPVVLKRKRQKYGDGPSPSVLRHFQEPDKPRPVYAFSASPDQIVHTIKKEPSDASPGMYYGGNLSPMYAGPGPSPQPTPIQSPQLPAGRTPSPGDYQPQSPFLMGGYGGFGQQPYNTQQPPASVSIPTMRNVHLAGGTCTTAPNFSPHSPSLPDMAHPGSCMSNAVQVGPQPSYPAMVEPMGLPHSPAGYNIHPPSSYDQQPPPPQANVMNGGLQAYSNVHPTPPVQVSSIELELNSSELYALGTWEGNLSEQMSSNLTLSEPGPSCG